MTPGAIVYVDTSALGALLIEQPESNALVEWLDQTTDVLVSSDLLETELRDASQSGRGTIRVP